MRFSGSAIVPNLGSAQAVAEELSKEFLQVARKDRVAVQVTPGNEFC